MGLDGIDIDYEYYYDDGQNNSGFTKGTQAQKFLKDVTLGLRNKLPSTAEISHAPMDADLVVGKGYYNVLVETASSVDFLNPQYYNGITRPAIDGIDGAQFGRVSTLLHYTNIVDNIYGGDATKVVFGFCILDCIGTNSNVNGAQAAKIMTDLSTHYKCNGGAFFWVMTDDVNADWSTAVSNVIAPNSGCSDITSTTCSDSPYRFKTVKPGETKRRSKDCSWAKTRATNSRCSWMGVSDMCPETCGKCDICKDSSVRMRFKKKNGQKINRDCEWTQTQPKSRCKLDGMKNSCRKTCGQCS